MATREENEARIRELDDLRSRFAMYKKQAMQNKLVNRYASIARELGTVVNIGRRDYFEYKDEKLKVTATFEQPRYDVTSQAYVDRISILVQWKVDDSFRTVMQLHWESIGEYVPDEGFFIPGVWREYADVLARIAEDKKIQTERTEYEAKYGYLDDLLALEEMINPR